MTQAQAQASAPHRRHIGEWLGQALRSARFPDVWLFLLAGCVGWAAGVLVSLMSRLTQLLHQLLYMIPDSERLSSQEALASPWQILVPLAGGIVLILSTLAARPFLQRPTVDPIEANALHGGQMSFTESLVVAGQTIISSGFGASVGLEAGYTQACALVGSKLAQALDLRRAEVRMLVGAGAAGAISAAFGAPLAGSFYAFETIIGVYNIATAAPVLAAALTAAFTARLMGAVQMPLLIGTLHPITSLPEALPYVLVGALSAPVAIGVMRLVILCETLFNLARCPGWLRPLIGGVAVGGLAFVSPHVLSSGHGALHVDMNASLTWQVLLALFALKALASAVSLGSGFRGGLFFASLYLGLLYGKGVAAALAASGLLGSLAPELLGVVGMAAMAVGIVGGPMTMSFLIMESTGDLTATAAVLAAAMVAGLVVRSAFGYSFSTWRLHLRGESIKGAHDVGRLRKLTVASMMRPDFHTAHASMTIADFRKAYPLGAAQRVVVLDEKGFYAGLVLVSEAHAPSREAEAPLSSMVKNADVYLLPRMSAKEAASLFEKFRSEELAVLESPSIHTVSGILTEQHLLRRYAEEMDKAQRDLTGL